MHHIISLIIAITHILTITNSGTTQITGWIYADNWFELYFNGQKVATDPLNFYPHNAVYISFTAPDSGLYSFAIWAQDYANSTTGLEPRVKEDGSYGGWCVGDGGLRIILSDGTVSGSNWDCFVTMQGPQNTACPVNDASSSDNLCLPKDNKPTDCNVTYNTYPSCWNQTDCSSATSANGWVSATNYTQDEIGGYGKSPDSDNTTWPYPAICGNKPIYQTEGCLPAKVDWGDSSFMWTSDLNYDNRIMCRYSYCVDGSSDCESEGEPSTTGTTTTEGVVVTETTPNGDIGGPTGIRPSGEGPGKGSDEPGKTGFETLGMVLVILVVLIGVLVLGYVAFRCIMARREANKSTNYREMSSDGIMDQQL